MKMTYGVLNALNENLRKMSGLTGKVGYAIAKTKRSIAAEAGVFAELRDNLITKYGEETENGYSVKPGSKHWNEFLKEYGELYSKEVDVTIHKISHEDFDIDKIYCENASADDYDIFEELMVEKEKKEEKEEKEEKNDNNSSKGSGDQEKTE